MAHWSWSGLCPAGLHGLDYRGQVCDICTPVADHCTECDGNGYHTPDCPNAKKPRLEDVIAELRNYELNGSDPVKQIRGIYSDLGSATALFIRYKKALEELEGFARRNEERARKAFEAADRQVRKDPFRSTETDRADAIAAKARYHEAVRVHQVIKLRVEEALHAK